MGCPRFPGQHHRLIAYEDLPPLDGHALIMSPAFLLDTNILSDLIRHPRGAVAARIAAAGGDAVCTNIVAAADTVRCGQIGFHRAGK